MNPILDETIHFVFHSENSVNSDSGNILKILKILIQAIISNLMTILIEVYAQ